MIQEIGVIKIPVFFLSSPWHSTINTRTHSDDIYEITKNKALPGNDMANFSISYDNCFPKLPGEPPQMEQSEPWNCLLRLPYRQSDPTRLLPPQYFTSTVSFTITWLFVVQAVLLLYTVGRRQRA